MQTAVLSPDLVRQFGQGIDSKGASGFQHDAFDIEHFQHGHTDAVFGREEDMVTRHPGQAVIVHGSDLGDGGTVDEAVHPRQAHRAAFAKCRSEAGPAKGFDKAEPGLWCHLTQVTRHARSQATATYRKYHKIRRATELFEHLDGDARACRSQFEP
jgi:hypothetical protein